MYFLCVQLPLAVVELVPHMTDHAEAIPWLRDFLLELPQLLLEENELTFSVRVKK